jgi:hypothetical protein
MNLGILTMGKGEAYERMSWLTKKTLRPYCDKFGYTLIEEEYYDPTRPPAWSKIYGLQQVLADFDWVLWVDADATLQRDDLPLTPFIENEEKDIVIQRASGKHINTGIFFTKNTPWSHDFLKLVYAQTQFLNARWWEQIAMVHLRKIPAIREHFKVYPRYSLKESFHGIWTDERREDDAIFIHLPAVGNVRRLMEIEKRVRYLESKERIRERVDLPKLWEQRGYKVGIEVGVYEGEYSEQILKSWGGTLHLVDPWEHIPGMRDMHNKSTKEFRKVFANCQARMQPFGNRCIIHEGTSQEIVDNFQDLSLDFVYIDADHTKAGEDFRLWFPKVRVGGMLAGHDFLDAQWKIGDFTVRSDILKLEGQMGFRVGLTYDSFASWYVTKQENMVLPRISLL